MLIGYGITLMDTEFCNFVLKPKYQELYTVQEFFEDFAMDLLCMKDINVIQERLFPDIKVSIINAEGTQYFIGVPCTLPWYTNFQLDELSVETQITNMFEELFCQSPNVNANIIDLQPILPASVQKNCCDFD